MAQGKRSPPEVRALAEALYREGRTTAEVRDIVHRVTGETLNDATFRRWRLKMKHGEGGEGASIYAELAKRITRGDLVQAFKVVMDTANRVRAEMPHLSLEHICRVVVLKVWARQLQWPDFDVLAEGLAYQWEVYGRLRELRPEDNEQIRTAVCYLRSVEYEVGADALTRAWELLEEVRNLLPPPPRVLAEIRETNQAKGG
jgi:hypothetical protein